MAHLDPASGQWVSDDAGPAPQDAGSIGMQTSPTLPPIPAPVPAPVMEPPPGPPMAPVPAPSPVAPVPVAAPLPAPGAPPAPVPVLPPVGVLPPARPQIVTAQKLDTPEHVAALKNVDVDNAQAVDASKAAGDLKVQGATAAADHAQTTADLQQSILAERDQRKAAAAAQAVKDNDAIAKATADGLKDPDAGESFTHRLLRALAIGLGQYSAAMNHTSNAAAEIFEADRKANIERQKAKIQAAKDAGKLNADQAQSDLTDLDAKELGQIKAFQSKWQAESARLGIPQARIDASATTVALQKQADEARAKLLDEDRVTVRDLTPKEVKEGKPKGAGGGGENADALAKFVDRAGALKPGEAVPSDLVILGRKAGFKAASIADQVDKYRNSGDKSKSTDNKANSAGAGGIGSVRQNAVLGNLAEAERAAADIKPGVVTPDTIAKLQSNEERSAAAHHSGESGVLGAIGAAAMRGVGAAPRGEYDGIPPDQQKAITAAKQVITHLTEMQQGKNIETLEQYNNRYNPYIPGLSADEMSRREKALPGLVAEQRATQDPTGVGRKRLDAAETTPAPSRRGPLAPDPRIKAAQDVLNNPTQAGKLTKGERAFLMKTVRGAKPKAPTGNGGEPMDDLTL